MIIKQIYQLADGAGAVLLPTNDIIKLTHQARGEQGWVNQLLIPVLWCEGSLWLRHGYYSLNSKSDFWQSLLFGEVQNLYRQWQIEVV